MAKIKLILDIEGKPYRWTFKCPGCGDVHFVSTPDANDGQAIWGFNNDVNKPTFTPSLLIKSGTYAGSQIVDENDLINYPAGKEWNDHLRLKNVSYICHSFVNNGFIEFLGDCTHELKNKIVELPDIL